MRYRDIYREFCMPVLDDYLDVVEAANILGIHWETAKRLCRERKIKAQKVHNKWLIHKEDLRGFAAVYDSRRRKGKVKNSELV